MGAITLGMGVYSVGASDLEGFRRAQGNTCLPLGRSWHILIELWPH
jgi:hypothetical protein